MEVEMRNLTEEELKLAPDWATHYVVDSDESIIYESEKLCWWVGRREPLNNEGSFGNLSNRTIKTFDITKHEFSDKALESCEYEEDGGQEKLLCFAVDEFNDCGAFFKLNKGDAIAIAKALGVTGGGFEVSADVVIYECGLRIGNKYSSFMESKDEEQINSYINIMRKSCDKGEIVKMKKLYRCISTTPLNVIDTSPIK